jgi:hypothetical protein
MSHAPVAQSVEQGAFNLQAVGSSPTRRTPPRTSSGRRAAGVHPKRLGEASQVEVYAALTRAGYAILLPLGDCLPYDCIIDDGRTLQRVQIKTGYEDGRGAVRWATRATSWNKPGGAPRSYHGRADLFAVWVPELRRCFLIPVSDCGRVETALRLSPARNNQRKGVRQAVDYEIG